LRFFRASTHGAHAIGVPEAENSRPVPHPWKAWDCVHAQSIIRDFCYGGSTGPEIHHMSVLGWMKQCAIRRARSVAPLKKITQACAWIFVDPHKFAPYAPARPLYGDLPSAKASYLLRLTEANQNVQITFRRARHSDHANRGLHVLRAQHVAYRRLTATPRQGATKTARKCASVCLLEVFAGMPKNRRALCADRRKPHRPPSLSSMRSFKSSDRRDAIVPSSTPSLQRHEPQVSPVE